MTTRAFLCLATFFVNLDNLWGFFTRGWIIDGPRKHLGNETFGLFQNTVSSDGVFWSVSSMTFSVYLFDKASIELSKWVRNLHAYALYSWLKMSWVEETTNRKHDMINGLQPFFAPIIVRPTFDVVANCPSDFWIMMMIIIIAIWAVTENVAVTPNQNEIWESGRERNIHFEK